MTSGSGAPALAAAASQLAVDLLVAHAGGEPEEGLVDVGDAVRPAPVRLPLGEPERLVGVAYTADDVTGALAQVGCAVAPEGADDVLEVTPPTWRPDLLQAADLVEEVARLHGYDAIGSVLPRALPGTAGQGGLPPRRRAVRAVTHLDISRDDAHRAAAALAGIR